MPKIIDLKGIRFERLIAIEKCGINKQGQNLWLCKCDCGNETKATTRDLKSKITRSCGCLSKEQTSKRFKTHGMTNDRIYKIWKAMRTRCLNPNTIAYKDYGGRGITICDRWLESFENFYEDMKTGYEPNLSIDRINYNGNYEPNNCKWSTMLEQSNNTRHNKFITVEGITDTVANMCRKYNKPYESTRKHIERGWTIEKAFNIK